MPEQLKKVIIVIPVYKRPESTTSIQRCVEILHNYDICFVAPKNLDTLDYEQILVTAGKQILIKRFNDKYFKSARSYSKLCLESKFYKAFSDYEYMFLFQEDGWIFKDELKYWCNKGFDYIGAPWFAGYDKADKNSPMIEFSGNGGVSLRKIPSFIRALNREESTIARFTEFLENFLHNGVIKTEFERLKNRVNEDVVITSYLRKKGLKIAPNKDAMFFSFETLPEQLYRLTGEKLPFACHAYKKYNPEFWKKFIDF